MAAKESGASAPRYEILEQGRWLARVLSRELTLLNIESNHAFAASSVDLEVLRAVHTPGPDERLTIDESSSDGSISLLVHRVLSNGLELKPQRVTLAPAVEELTVVKALTELVAANREASSALEAAQTTMSLQEEYLEDMVAEKQDYQDTVLRKVANIIEDRNVRLARAHREASIEAFGTVKPEPDLG